MEYNRPLSAYRGSSRKIFKSLPNEVGQKSREVDRLKIEFLSKKNLLNLVGILKEKLKKLEEENKSLRESQTRDINLSSAVSRLESPTKIKSSDLNTEAEIKLLRRENIKKQQIINEALKHPPPSYLNLYEKYLEQKITIKKLKNKVLGSKSAVRVLPKKGNFSNRQDCIDMNVSSLKDFASILKLKAREQELEPDEIWYVLNPNHYGSITFQEFHRGVKALNIDYSLEYFQQIFRLMTSTSNLDSCQLNKIFN